MAYQNVRKEQLVTKHAGDEEFVCKMCASHVVGCQAQLSKCSHLFCHDCIDRAGDDLACPECNCTLNKDTDLMAVKKGGHGISGFLWRLNQQLLVKCAKPGCEWVGSLDQYSNHMTGGSCTAGMCVCAKELPWPRSPGTESVKSTVVASDEELLHHSDDESVLSVATANSIQDPKSLIDDFDYFDESTTVQPKDVSVPSATSFCPPPGLELSEVTVTAPAKKSNRPGKNSKDTAKTSESLSVSSKKKQTTAQKGSQDARTWNEAQRIQAESLMQWQAQQFHHVQLMQAAAVQRIQQMQHYAQYQMAAAQAANMEQAARRQHRRSQ